MKLGYLYKRYYDDTEYSFSKEEPPSYSYEIIRIGYFEVEE